MSRIKFNTLLTFAFIFAGQLALGQNDLFRSFALEANLNINNKKRSYGVYNGEKYANSGYFIGSNFGLKYEREKLEYGLEYYSSFNHLNASIGYRGLKIARENPKIVLIPNLKFGYSTELEKLYYGFGTTLQLHWFSFSYNRLFHVKSGTSRYHGDGLTVFSIGAKLRLANKRE